MKNYFFKLANSLAKGIYKMTIVNIHEAKSTLSQLIQKVLNGEQVLIAKSNKPVAKLVPFDENQKERKLGFAKDTVILSEDFDEPLEDFKEYM